MNQTRKNTIAIWGGGSSGIRYEALIKDAGYQTIVLKRDSKKNQFNFNDLDLSTIKAAVICTPTIFHSEQSIQFLENNIPVLCEKPISHNLISGQNIIDTAIKYQTKFYPGYNQRFLQAYKIFKKNDWGTPIRCESVWAERVSNWQPNKDYRDSYSVRKELGGGVPLTLSHDFDWWTGIYNDLKVKEVQSSNNGTLDVSIDTHFEIKLEGNITCNLILDYEASQSTKRYYKVYYEDGSLEYFPLTGDLNFYRKNGEIQNIPIEKNWKISRMESFKSTFEYFINDSRHPESLSEWELGLTALNVASIVDCWHEK